MYAVFHTGGKQYRVKKGDTVQVELLPVDFGAKMNFKEILLVGEGAEVKVGQPFVASAEVSAEVVAVEKGPKIIVYHKKRRKQSDKKNGHRQPYTRLLITSIDNGSGQKEILSDEEKKTVLANTGFAKADAWAYEEESFEEETDTSSTAEKKPAKKAASASKAPVKKTAPAAKAKKTAKVAAKKQ